MASTAMSLAWLRSHARNRDRRARSRSNPHSIRQAAQIAHRQFAGAEAYAPRIEYDNSFVPDSSVTSQDANWLTDEQYKRQYTRLGWDVAPIRKDGNSLFRALSDQLYGHERRHLELRRRLVDFIDLEQAFFEPFVAGEGVVEYCARLREAGAWGGHPELVAASRLLGVNIIVHTGPVKRLRIDTDKYAKHKEGKGKTINLLLKHDHYSSLRKRLIPISQQHGCSDMCLCRRIVAPSRGSSMSSRASLGARPSELGSLSSRPSDVGRHSLGARPTDLDFSRDSIGERSSDLGFGSDKRARSPRRAERKGVPPPPEEKKHDKGEHSPLRKKQQRTPAKPKSRPPPPPEKPKTPAPAPPTQKAPAKPKSPAPAPPAKPSSALPVKPRSAPPAKPASAPPARPQRSAPAPPAKPVSAPPVKPQVSTPAPPARAKAAAPAKPKIAAPAPPVKPKAASPRQKQVPTPPTKPKSAGVVLFQPESLAPVVKPKAPLVVLFEPEDTPVSKPTSTPTKKTTVNTATPSKPKSAVVMEVEVEEPETISGKHEEVPECGVHIPRRAVFNAGRRRSSGAAFSLMQEVSVSLSPTRPTADPKPKAPSMRNVEVKKSSKKVFRGGKLVPAC